MLTAYQLGRIAAQIGYSAPAPFKSPSLNMQYLEGSIQEGRKAEEKKNKKK